MKNKTLSEHQSKASKARWKNVPEEERSRIMKEAVMKRKYRPVKQLPKSAT